STGGNGGNRGAIPSPFPPLPPVQNARAAQFRRTKKVSDAAAKTRNPRRQNHRSTTRNRWPKPVAPPHSLDRLVRQSTVHQSKISRAGAVRSRAPDRTRQPRPGEILPASLRLCVSALK